MRRLLPALFFVCFALDAVAATRPKRVEIWDLEFGAKVDAIPDEFVVGYGLDYSERYRNLRVVGTLAPHVYS